MAAPSASSTASSPSSSSNPPRRGGDTVVITVWPSHEVFDAWIATPHRDALTASEVHQAVDYRPITRYEVPAATSTCPASPSTTHPHRPDTRGAVMKWITRARPKTDRIACPWLIRQFIDPDAEILYVPADQVLDVAAARGARISFDAPGATLHPPRRQVHLRGPHRRLPPRRRPGAGAPGHDRARRRHRPTTSTPTRPARACWPSAWAGSTSKPTTSRLLERGTFVYDALYAWCQRQVAAQPA